MSRRVGGERDVGAAAAAQPPVALPLSSHSLPTPGIKGTAPPPPPHYETATIRRGSCGHRGIIAAHNNYPQRLQIRRGRDRHVEPEIDAAGGERAHQAAPEQEGCVPEGGLAHRRGGRRRRPQAVSGRNSNSQLMNPAFSSELYNINLSDCLEASIFAQMNWPSMI